MQRISTQRLVTSNYNRPKHTIQDKLTEEDKKNWDFKMKIYNDAIELKKLAINLVVQENNRQYELDKLKIQSETKARIYAYKRKSIAKDIAKQLYLMKSKINYSNIIIN